MEIGDRQTMLAMTRAFFGQPYFRLFHLTGCEDDLTAPPSTGDDPRTREGKHMTWAIIVIAGLFEMGWAIGLKYAEGFTHLWPSVWTILSMLISLWLLGIAMKVLPVGTAYSVWVGVGAVGTVILGIVLFGEPANAGRLISLAFIIAGIVGLKLSTQV